MKPRVVYDTTIFLQWAMLPAGRQYATVRALEEGTIALFLSAALLGEVQRVLNDPEIQRHSAAMTPGRAQLIIDNIFNLAIAVQADYLVVWETRLLELDKKHPNAAEALRRLAPRLQVVTPESFSRELRRLEAQDR